MARKEDVCSVPGCTNEVGNRKRGLCSACASSLYYWNRKRRESRGAILKRQQKLSFWSGRLDWMFQPAFSRSKGPMAPEVEDGSED